MRDRAAGVTPSRDPQAHTAGQTTRRVPLRAVRTGRLRTRLLLTVTGLVVLISLVSGLSTVLVVSRQLRRQLERQGEILAAQLARDAIKDQQEDDPQARRLRLQVLTYRVAADASFAQVVVNGEAVSEFAAADIRGLPDPPQPVAGLAVREVVVEADAGPARFLEFVQALPDPPKAQSQDGRPSLPSYVRVGLPLSPIAHFIVRLAFTLSVITVAFAVGGGVLALELYRRVLGPLDHLVRTVEQVRCGDLSARAPVRSDDELGVVAGEFNRMIEALAARERRLQEVNLELTRAYQAKSEFLAMMGHEWKTPLHSIRGYCQLLLEQIDGPLNAEQIQDVEAILRAATHLIDLVDNLLHFNATADETAVANPEPVDLTALTGRRGTTFGPWHGTRAWPFRWSCHRSWWWRATRSRSARCSSTCWAMRSSTRRSAGSPCEGECKTAGYGGRSRTRALEWLLRSSRTSSSPFTAGAAADRTWKGWGWGWLS